MKNTLGRLGNGGPAAGPERRTEIATSAAITPKKTGDSIETLPLSALRIDPLYQRHISIAGQKRIERMAAEWDAALVGMLQISARTDGTYVVMDGQHRYRAAVAAGIAELPVIVHTGLTPDEEARRFDRLNTLAVRPSYPDLFRARLVAGDETARAVTRVVHDLGLSISLHHSASERSLIQIGTLVAITDATSPEHLRWTLATILSAWPSGGTERWTAAIPAAVAGFGFLYAQHPDYRPGRLGEALRIIAPREVLYRLQGHARGTGSTAGSSKFAKIIRPMYRVAMLDLYNFRKRRDLLPDLSGSDIHRIVRGENPWA